MFAFSSLFNITTLNTYNLCNDKAKKEIRWIISYFITSAPKMQCAQLNLIISRPPSQLQILLFINTTQADYFSIPSQPVYQLFF